MRMTREFRVGKHFQDEIAKPILDKTFSEYLIEEDEKYRDNPMVMGSKTNGPRILIDDQLRILPDFILTVKDVNDIKNHKHILIDAKYKTNPFKHKSSLYFSLDLDKYEDYLTVGQHFSNGSVHLIIGDRSTGNIYLYDAKEPSDWFAWCNRKTGIRVPAPIFEVDPKKIIATF